MPVLRHDHHHHHFTHPPEFNEKTPTRPWTQNRSTDNGHDHEDLTHNNSSGILIAVSCLCVMLIVIGLFCIMCYREISKRHIESRMMVEKNKRDNLRDQIKSKVEEMNSHEDNSISYMEVMQLKTPLVTFGKVTTISPVPSSDSISSMIDKHLHRYHHHHHHHHHHYHKLGQLVGEEEVEVGEINDNDGDMLTLTLDKFQKNRKHSV